MCVRIYVCGCVMYVCDDVCVCDVCVWFVVVWISFYILFFLFSHKHSQSIWLATSADVEPPMGGIIREIYTHHSHTLTLTYITHSHTSLTHTHTSHPSLTHIHHIHHSHTSPAHHTHSHHTTHITHTHTSQMIY